ncbi:MAG: lytic murein transglycosylase [Deltaproteobacteria bacterium]|nr:lytic murein transglycosylase [Deltaproteobacteria bacterium]
MYSVTMSALILIGLFVTQSAEAAPSDFSLWLEAFTVEARERGISQSTLDASLENVERIPAVIELDRRQPKEPGDFCGYINARLTKTRIERGRRLLKEHWNLLQRVSSRYGVPARFIVALWGLETNFGDYQGDYPLINALATLAYDERRGALFRKQLLAALRIVDEGHQNPADLKGSWAGAMGQVQLMPTTFLDYAVDYDGDGRKDIWSSLPDALASAANYLKHAGWRSGQTWGREVQIPASLSGDRRALVGKRSLSDWRGAGVVRIDGGALPSANMRGKIVLPAAKRNDAFLVYSNFDTILRWNQSIFFGISVGSLADELSHAASLRACRS